MNNAIFHEEIEDAKPIDTSEQQALLTRKIEAIDGLLKTRDWYTLAELHFAEEERRIERLLLSEAKKGAVDDKEIYRLQGELKWAKRYADLGQFAKYLKSQLDNLKHGK